MAACHALAPGGAAKGGREGSRRLNEVGHGHGPRAGAVFARPKVAILALEVQHDHARIDQLRRVLAPELGCRSCGRVEHYVMLRGMLEGGARDHRPHELYRPCSEGDRLCAERNGSP